ncbi:MAG: PQQ-binding-like beta-propeller repeat protein [bacterium]
MGTLIILGGFLLQILSFGAVGQTALAKDRIEKTSHKWPQWRGPNRDGCSKETDLIETFPKSGPEVLWRVEIGSGYSGIAVVDEYLYTMYSEGDHEFALCLDVEAGLEVWRFTTDKIYLNQHGSGPRSTPTVDDDRVYLLSAKGKLYALRASDKKRIWQIDLRESFRTGIPKYGFATSPMIEKDLLIMEIGDVSGNSVVAFNKYDGTVVWRTGTHVLNHNHGLEYLKDQPGYSSPIAVTSHGYRQIIIFTASQLIAVSPTGDLVWGVPWVTRNGANVMAPIFLANNRIFISSGYNKGASLWQINTSGGKLHVDEVWRNKVMRNEFSSAVYHDGYIYGFDKGSLKCVDAADGKQKWKKTGIGRGNLIYADGQLIVLGERGKLLLVQASEKGYREKAKAKIVKKGKCWTPPSLANGRLFIRNQFEIICVNLKKCRENL